MRHLSITFIWYSISNTFMPELKANLIITSEMATWHLLSTWYYCVFPRHVITSIDRSMKYACHIHSERAMQPFQLWHSCFPQSNVWGWYQKCQKKEKHVIKMRRCLDYFQFLVVNDMLSTTTGDIIDKNELLESFLLIAIYLFVLL